MNRTRRLLITLPMLATGRLVAQESYPTRPITLVIPSVAGGILDTIGRIVGRSLEPMGQTVVYQNVPGAGSILGTDVVARAAPDGYTIAVVATSHAINPSVYAKMPYDTARDLAPVVHTVNLTNVLVVNPSVPANNLLELIALAKRKPGALTFGSAGIGQSNHLSGEMLRVAAGIDIMHVPYKGSAAAMNDVLAGHVSMMFVDLLSATPHMKAGKLRALAATGLQRSASAPEIPTLHESGATGFNGNSWLGLVGRSGTPRFVLDRLSAVVSQGLRDSATRQRLLAQGVEPVGGTPDDFAAFLESETRRYAAAVSAAGIKRE
ncbi:MAG: tripartite tricarboxylate transporter substrate binding protein [Burkholderiaceae bacterium]|nr:tripartite tricarboxylate transporter substrate binding protein [Burkholderiaceae bacterium]